MKRKQSTYQFLSDYEDYTAVGESGHINQCVHVEIPGTELHKSAKWLSTKMKDSELPKGQAYRDDATVNGHPRGKLCFEKSQMITTTYDNTI